MSVSPWKRDFVILLLLLGVLAIATWIQGELLFWLSGLCCGWGLKIGVVNIWPNTFKPRLAYHKENISK